MAVNYPELSIDNKLPGSKAINFPRRSSSYSSTPKRAINEPSLLRPKSTHQGLTSARETTNHQIDLSMSPISTLLDSKPLDILATKSSFRSLQDIRQPHRPHPQGYGDNGRYESGLGQFLQEGFQQTTWKPSTCSHPLLEFL
jgi:hypothetical protein